MSLPSVVAWNTLAAISDRRPQIHPDRCRRSRNARSACDTCRAHCPSSAITFSVSGPQVDDRCVGCDVCVAVCENDAFARAEESDPGLLQRLVRGAQEGSVTVSCCVPAPGVVVVPCVARMSWLLLVHCAASGVSAVTFDVARCLSCAQVRGLSHLANDVALATLLASALGASLHVTATTADGALAPGPRHRTFARRSLLHLLRSGAPEPSTQTDSTSPGTNLRDALVLMLLTRLESSPEPLQGKWPFGQVTIDASRCDGCKACSGVCRSGALLRDELREQVQLLFDPAKCNRCGECSSVCRRKALQLAPARLELVGRGASTIARVGGHRCKLCGATARGNMDGPCRLCREAGSRLRGTRAGVV